ncbi:MAG: sulfatase-like hydrolase/transferase [Verrucomicrobia bacterium]|nr:sulfatase-like hydrolase/transferase [Verrucomicrobiota bacterium]
MNRTRRPRYLGSYDLAARLTAWMQLLLLLGPGAAPGPAHESTFHRFERLLDARETVALARTSSLHQDTAAGAGGQREGRLTLRLVDAETKQPLPGLVRIVGASGRGVELPGLLSRGLKLRAAHPGKEWYVLPEPGVVAVPREQLRIEAFSGLETELAITTVDLRESSGRELVVPLQRFLSAGRLGWRSGNTHLHVRGMTRGQADEYLRTLPTGDGVELIFVSHLARAKEDRDYISNSYARADLEALSSSILRFGNGEEHRHNFGSGGEGYGHVMFLDLPSLVHPVSIGAGITGGGPDYPPLRRGIDQARAQGATIVWCHNAFGFEHAPDWISGRLHAHNIFDGGSQGSYAHTYYRFLNLGLKVSFSTGTDWFMYDFSRVYVQLKEPLTVQNWLRGLAAGRTFITNGPLLELQAGRHQVGDTVALRGPERIAIRARATGRSNFQALELVHNGRVVHRAPSRAVRGHFVAELEYPLAVEHSGWVAARTSGGALDTDGLPVVPSGLPINRGGAGRNELGEALFSHTSAIYFDLTGRPLFDRAAAQALMEEMEKNLRTIQAKARFDDEQQRAEVTGIYRDAIEQLRHRPNILLVVADDLGYGDLACFGHSEIKTPNLDRLAEAGLKLTHCYSAAANCSPARAAIMTGRTPYRVGIYNQLSMMTPVHLRAGEITVASLFKQAGYATAQVGKWHLNGLFNLPGQPQPNDHGFDHWFAVQNNALPNHRNPYNFVRNGIPQGPIVGYSSAIVANEAIAWLTTLRDKSKPFFLYVAFNEPHEPIATDPRFQSLYQDKHPDDPSRVAYYGNVTQMDDALGRILQTLDSHDLAKDTVVWFTSDNGPARTRWHNAGSTAGLREFKGHLYEGGIRVPGIVRWPGNIKPGRSSAQPVSGVDVLPTLCQIAGIAAPSNRKLDGASIVPVLLGNGAVQRTKPLFWEFIWAGSRPQVALRDGRWKLLAALDGPKPKPAEWTEVNMQLIKTARLTGFELYDLDQDPAEKTDLAAANPEKLAELRKNMEAIHADVRAEGPVWPPFVDPRYEQLRIEWPDYVARPLR